ncbi:MAG: 23S rRNA (uracil(1939)-C(5))-methyltransferase RlmD [Saprospiraceae bacterium]|nr:23S rRNA (uracil(1939)-C(5))-methyltransferase RlmD [Saprospiraceae bacterium]MBK7790579.1 23S rRNA (uracil(1939)-C(5))-methyltransferase RlmD [Saprospiraceae bacterium]MBK8848697.1 23S rRNA (uracil(1939)-C(5))-methyltransferase RlmD [Saprospiraceae bacterium]MBK9688558.1 23S rRNA (uracil(1939)-C(5))-methyltransferase RlmD [Saprospiraceae bacterium]
MGRRKKNKRVVENILITGIADKGMSVGRNEEGEVFFIEDAVPGDVVNAVVIRKKKSHSICRVKETVTLSPERTTPFCKHFYHCGGCKWQNLKYDSQTKYKFIKIVNAMRRIGKMDTEGIIHTVRYSKDIRYYRNKLEFTFCDKRWLTPEEIETKGFIETEPALGFHRPNSFNKVLNLDECHLQNDLSNDIRNHLRDFCIEKQISFYNPYTHEGVMRNIIIRNTLEGDWMLLIVFGKDDAKKIKVVMEEMKQKFPFITSLLYTVNPKFNDTIYDLDVHCYHGRPFIIERLGDVRYKIGPKSFFQTNSEGAKILFDYVAEYADFKGHENVYDLYTGLGSIALYIAHSVGRVTGIEEIPEAIADAKENCAFNGIENASFYAGDVKDILNDDFIREHGQPDVVITDPPRAGMSEKVIQTLLALAAPKIVYVSCNPETQARDVLMLSEKYKVVKMQPVDMFPHTNHIENVALLVLKP